MESPEKILSRRVSVELCVDSASGARIAREVGADRIEVASALECGGLTPSVGLLESALAEFRGPVVVLIRPRPGDFVYDSDDLAIMRRDIDHCLRLGVHGIAIGALTREGEIDVDLTENLMDHSRPLAVTFHRAFDWAADHERALTALLALRVDRILTSGRAPDALRGAPAIRRAVERTRGVLSVMAGGGIDPGNVGRVLEATQVSEVHGSAGAWMTGSGGNPDVQFRSQAPTDTAYRVTDRERARRFVEAARAEVRPTAGGPA